MKTKQSTSNLHDKALLWCADMKRTRKEQRAHETFTERRAEAKKSLKEVFAQMQASFENGDAVGGCTSMKQWCKVYKRHGALTYARVRQILTGKSGHEGKRSSSLTLKPGSMFTVDGMRYRIPENILRHSDHVATVQTHRTSEMRHVTFWVEEIKEEPKPQSVAPKQTKLMTKLPPTVDEVREKKVVAKETLIAEGVRIIDKLNGQFTRTIWREESKYPEQRITKHWDRFNDFAQEVIKASFANEPAKSETAKKPVHFYDGALACRRTSKGVGHNVSTDPAKTTCRACLTTSRWLQAKAAQNEAVRAAKAAAAPDPKKAKTHVMSRHTGPTLTRCRKESSEVQIAAPGEQPTCHNCTTSTDLDHRIELGKEFDALVAGTKLTKKETNRLYREWAMAKKGYVINPNDSGEYVADGEAAAKIAADPLSLLSPLCPAAEAMKETLETIAPEIKDTLKRHKAAAALGIGAGSNCPTQEHEQ
jgi:hypothetical protein